MDKHSIDLTSSCEDRMWKTQIRIGRNVRCCVPGVARPRGRGRLSRNVSPGLTRDNQCSAKKKEKRKETNVITVPCPTTFSF